MKLFKVEQIALAPARPEAARRLLAEMGAKEWTDDIVTGNGEVYGADATNRAHLQFNYEIAPCEFEILNYDAGDNWLAHRASAESAASHLAMHCTEQEAEEWKQFFAERNIELAQELQTVVHTNPAVGDRRWKYYIFNTRSILGLDIKLIVRA